MDRTTLLVDGDIFVYLQAVRFEEELREQPFDVGEKFHWAANKLEHMIREVVDTLEVDDVVFFFSRGRSHRYELYPSYKSNRRGKDKPMMFGLLKQFARNRWRTVEVNGLEADDMIGIAATHPSYHRGIKIIMSNDKDFYTIPGRYLNYGRAMKTFKEQGVQGLATLADHVEIISEMDAHYFHMYQTLCGDTADGYPGAPGVGDVKAKAFLDARLPLLRTEREIKRGARKGEVEVKWVPASQPVESLWDVVVSVFKSLGLDEDDALLSARLAFILHAPHWDGKTSTIIRQWDPSDAPAFGT